MQAARLALFCPAGVRRCAYRALVIMGIEDSTVVTADAGIAWRMKEPSHAAHGPQLEGEIPVRSCWGPRGMPGYRTIASALSPRCRSVRVVGTRIALPHSSGPQPDIAAMLSQPRLVCKRDSV